MGERPHKIDELAPEFEAAALDLWIDKRWNRKKIWQEFCVRYGDTVIARSSFYRWFEKILTVNRRDEEIRKKATAMVEAAAEGNPDVKEFAHNLAVQAIARLLYEAPNSMDPIVLVRAVSALDKVKRTDLDLEKFRAQVQARTDAAASETKTKLAAAGVKKATVDEIAKQMYGIAG